MFGKLLIWHATGTQGDAGARTDTDRLCIVTKAFGVWYYKTG